MKMKCLEQQSTKIIYSPSQKKDAVAKNSERRRSKRKKVELRVND